MIRSLTLAAFLLAAPATALGCVGAKVTDALNDLGIKAPPQQCISTEGRYITTKLTKKGGPIAWNSNEKSATVLWATTSEETSERMGEIFERRYFSNATMRHRDPAVMTPMGEQTTWHHRYHRWGAMEMTYLRVLLDEPKQVGPTRATEAWLVTFTSDPGTGADTADITKRWIDAAVELAAASQPEPADSVTTTAAADDSAAVSVGADGYKWTN